MLNTKLFRDFFNSEKVGGLILLGCTFASLAIANSSFGGSYDQFWHSYIDLSIPKVPLRYSTQHWVNDGLMAIFFLLVGLEIEREIFKGELSDFKNAILPIGAAVGGMLIPAAIHFFLNKGTATQSGFGIPMATDIAFALGMLSLAGKRVPYSLKIFLTALAIIDDLGAIVVIALFYSGGISWYYLLLSVSIFIMLMVLNKLKVYRLSFYLIPGVIMWYFMLKSGVHATIAGILLAIAIPLHERDDKDPSYKLQNALHKPVAFIILPIFALANTGIVLHNGWFEKMAQSNNLGIILGLLIGKPVGILLFCWVLVKGKLATLPQGVTWKYLIGAGILAGIGFTMSIFISNLAFKEDEIIQYAKMAVLAASLLATVVGLGFLFSIKPQKT